VRFHKTEEERKDALRTKKKGGKRKKGKKDWSCLCDMVPRLYPPDVGGGLEGEKGREEKNEKEEVDQKERRRRWKKGGVGE
jgi:hypothetical protein